MKTKLVKNKKQWLLAVVIGCAALLSVGAASAQQEIAPTATLEVPDATVVDAQPNYVMAATPPSASDSIPPNHGPHRL